MSVESAAPQDPPALWEPELWDELLYYVEERRVIPIVGPDLIVVDTAEGSQPLGAYLATELASRLDLPAFTNAQPSINDVVCAYLALGRRREALYPRVKSIVQEAQFAPPESLRLLADIAHFDLFVTTTFDTLLEDAINQVRFAGQARTVSLAYNPRNFDDLNGAKSDLTSPVVYHLFGRVAASPSYVLSDEDLLESVCALQTPAKCPERLSYELERNHLLILGEHFADWLARLFLRTAKGQRLSESREVLEIVADSRTHHQDGLVSFLRHFSSRTRVYQGGAIEFVRELHRRYRERYPAEAADAVSATTPPSEMPNDAVFVSYTSADRAAVEGLKTGLEASGIPVWFDQDKLRAGDDWRATLRRNVERCCLFVPVLSANTEARDEGEFRREWAWALDRKQRMARNRPFIVPVVIDATTTFRRADPIDRLHIERVPDGTVSPEFAAHVAELYNRVRRDEASR